jgi:hypothetical protein
MLEALTRRDEDAAARPFEPTHDREHVGDDQRQHEERVRTAGGEHAIVDGEHVERGR